MNISIIAAVASNGAIGKDNQLLCQLSKDMKRFVSLTKKAGVVIMGRKTHESIGKLLPGRVNIVLTKDKNYQPTMGVFVFTDFDKLVNFCRYYKKEVIVIGGGEIYRLFLPHANKLYITNINAPLDGDIYFPAMADYEWVHMSETIHNADAKHRYQFSFDIYKRVDFYSQP